MSFWREEQNADVPSAPTQVLANSSRVLRLPLSGNALLAHSKRLSLNYYRTVLAKS
jgi:hypothetical protein